MREREEVLQPESWLADTRDRLRRRWLALDEWLRPGSVPEQFEGAVQVALRPVEPSASFRESLRGNLTVAARSKMSGLIVEYPRPLREGIILGLSAGLLAVIVSVLVLVFRSRSPGAAR